MDNRDEWTCRASQYLFKSRWFSVRQDDVTLPAGERINFTLIEHPGYAMVVPLLDDGRVILERIYRYTVGKTVLECPSGGLDGEPPELAARRELEEETGWLAESLAPLGSFYGSTGISDEQFHLFLATDLSDSGALKREITEQIQLEFIPLEHADQLALSGEVPDAPTCLALILAQQQVGAGLTAR
jgi:ADP-ribose pyrophosphatase